MTEDRLEKALRGAEFTNAAHRSRLKETLFGSADELSFEVLEMAAGGIGREAYDAIYTDIFGKRL